MKKTLLSVFALFTFSLCNAQVKTQSNYDVDGNGEVTIEDVTSTVHKVLGKASDDRTMVDGESLNALLLRLEQKLDALQKEHELIMEKLGRISTVVDPYNGHEYVDLGLPSGLKWATCNVGASKSEEYGDYFAWGETEPYYTEGHSQDSPCSNWKTNKTGYNWASYNWCNGSSSTQTKYCTSSSYGTVDNKTVLDLADDAAHVNWGGEWRMPTKEEQDELRTKCTWTWGSQNGVNGYTVVGPNGNSLFLPAAGYRLNSVLYDVGSYGYYGSSSLSSSYSNNAYVLYLYSSDVLSDYNGRRSGQSVRPVCP